MQASLSRPLILALLSLALPAISPALAQTTPEPTATERDLTGPIEPLWIDLTDSQREILKPFEEQWNIWRSDEKRIWVVLANRFPTFSARAKDRALLRIHEWASLTPEERDIARHNYQLARERGKAERQVEWRRYQQMTPEQQSVLRASGTFSNTAAGSIAPSGLARDAAKPLSIKPLVNEQDGR